ncbi:MAG: autotransporter-associated beta strand repeat-containing protein, partial [Verrucomicrobiota bacterium]
MKTNKATPFHSQVVRFTAFTSCLSALVLLLANETRAATLSWSGGSPTTSNWSDIQNWGFAGTPTTGDTLIFPGAQPRLANVNDIAGLTVSEIRFVGASGGYTISGNAFTVTNGITATNTAGVNAMANNIALASVGLINVGSGASLTLSGALSGSVGVTKVGLGTLTYSGAANSYSGNTLVLEGTLELGKSGDSAIPNTLQVGDPTHSATVRWLSGNQIPNTSTVTVYGGSVLDVNNLLDDLGTLNLYDNSTVNMGTGFLDFRPPHTITVLSGSAIINGRVGLPSGDVTMDMQSGSNPALNMNASVGNIGGIIKTGPGGLSLNSSNGYGGLTVVQSGWLWIKNASGLGSSSSGTVVSNNASLVLQGAFGVTNESLTLNGFGANSSWGAFDTESGFTNFWTGPITLNATSTIAPWSSGNVLRISGAVSGPGGFILGSQSGGGLGICYLEGVSANTYAGTTIVNGGTLCLNKSLFDVTIPHDLIIGDGAGTDAVRLLQVNQIPNSANVTINTGGILDLNGVAFEGVGNLEMTGGTVQTGVGFLDLYGNTVTTHASGVQSTISGTMNFLGGTTTFNIENGPPGTDLLVSAALGGSGGLIKNGAGNLQLSAANTYNGLTTINDGFIIFNNAAGLGSAAAGTVLNGGNLSVVGATVLAEPLTNNSANSILQASGTAGWGTNVVLNADLEIQVLGGGNFDISGPISGAGNLTKTIAGTLRFSGAQANTYVGNTTVQDGTLELNKPAIITAIPGKLAINNGATARLLNIRQTANSTDVLVNGGGLFDFGTFYTYLDTLRGSGTVNFGVGGWIWIGLNNGSSTFDGQFTGVGYASGWTVGTTGTGTFTMNGNNTFSAGNITIQGGGKTVINGAQPQVWVRISDTTSTLGGVGTVGIITAPGNISPGSSAGILTCSNLVFTASGNYFVELNGPTPGTGYDQLNVRGTNNLAGATLHVSPGFTTPVGVGQQFIII